MKIADIVCRFNTTPFIFVGSGMTRRYLNLPDWKELLSHFANIINEDEFAYSADVSSYTIMIDEQQLTMKKIQLEDYLLLYNA